jgi:radical SAM protein with 4Fe4S-binding SPASM domain
MAHEGIPVSLLCVVREEHTRNVPEIVRWTGDMGLPIRLNPLFALGRGGEALSEKTYYQFLKELFALFLTLPADVPVNPLTRALEEVLLNRPSSECSFSGACGRSILALFPDGTAGPCGRSSVRYGSVFRFPLPELWDCAERKRLAERGKRLDGRCGGCSIRPWCNGGCPAVNGDAPGAEYCSERRAFFAWLASEGMSMFQESLVNEKKRLKNDLTILETAREELGRMSDVRASDSQRSQAV